MRTELKVFRVRQEMTQAEFADMIGVNRVRYSQIEKGSRNGTNEFWQSFQKAFKIDNAEMWRFMQNET